MVTGRAAVAPPWELSEATRACIRAKSKTMFGNADRLDVAVAVALDPVGVVNATDLQWKLHLANNRIRAQLLTFVDLGFMRAEAVEGERGKRLFTRLEHPFWDLCVERYEAWCRDSNP